MKYAVEHELFLVYYFIYYYKRNIISNSEFIFADWT